MDEMHEKEKNKWKSFNTKVNTYSISFNYFKKR